MEYQEKLEKIVSLSEKQFRQDVLIPLFVSMGFQNVIEYHGAGERGKDIIFYDIDRLGDKVYFGVVVKSEKIHGSIGKSGSIADVAFTQVLQALNEPYVDVYGLEQLEIGRCLVITSKEIVTTCVEAFFQTLRKHELHRSFRCYDGNWVVQQINRHLASYWGDEEADRIIKGQEAQIAELNLYKEKATGVIFKLTQDYGAPSSVFDVSSGAVQKAESSTTLASALYSGVSGEVLWYGSQKRVTRSQLLKNFVDEGIMSETVTCQRCGNVNTIDLNSTGLSCTKCFYQIL
jgi:hypothetical protein